VCQAIHSYMERQKRPIDKYLNCQLIHYPLMNKYSCSYEGKFPFRAANGEFTLLDAPLLRNRFKTKEEAIAFLDLYLEYLGKGGKEIKI